ncbi:hypothetical protein BD413DRAFT_304615 [Trametes elegans]|nr:hypothetical protein BD413DRAFT_304615 [Trametes elegans]
MSRPQPSSFIQWRRRQPSQRPARCPRPGRAGPGPCLVPVTRVWSAGLRWRVTSGRGEDVGVSDVSCPRLQPLRHPLVAHTTLCWLQHVSPPARNPCLDHMLQNPLLAPLLFGPSQNDRAEGVAPHNLRRPRLRTPQDVRRAKGGGRAEDEERTLPPHDGERFHGLSPAPATVVSGNASQKGVLGVSADAMRDKWKRTSLSDSFLLQSRLLSRTGWAERNAVDVCGPPEWGSTADRPGRRRETPEAHTRRSRRGIRKTSATTSKAGTYSGDVDPYRSPPALAHSDRPSRNLDTDSLARKDYDALSTSSPVTRGKIPQRLLRGGYHTTSIYQNSADMHRSSRAVRG